MTIQKKIGIITMHRVINAGSALQAYALYHTVQKLGYQCEIIDYQYPNRFHQQEKKTIPFFTRLWLRLKYFILYRSRKQHARFKLFQSQAWASSAYYETREHILNNPPKYDLCITGSDQVWNPRCMKGDSVFFCAFSPNTPRIAYASSFAQGDIPQNLELQYAHHLSGYKTIGIRENSGVKIINRLTKKQAEVVCDPTLLLTASDYTPFIKQAQIHIKRSYLLAYILDYAFNPYPTIEKVIRNISQELDLGVIYLMANTVDHYRIGKSITSAGPNEYLKLFSEASYIVTSSFHGVAFSLIFEKDFYAITPNKEQEDGRIQTLLHTVGATDRAIKQGTDTTDFICTKVNYETIRPKIEKYRQHSSNFLQSAIAEAL